MSTPETGLARSGPADPATRRTAAWVLLFLTLVTLAGTLVVHVSPWVTKGFGYSHDGYNGAVWGLGARGAHEDPIGNRLGGVQPGGHRYANHPPLLVWTTAVSSGATDERPIAMRAPAMLASLAALVVLVGLLLDAGFGPGAVAGGLAIAGTSAMFLTYGAMLDTPVVALPFGLAAIWAAQRAWQGRPPPRAVLTAIGVLAALAGWQSTLAIALASLAAWVGPHPAGRSAARWLAVGGAGGVAATLAWVVWVKGTLAKLGDMATFRAGTGTSDWWTHQQRYLDDLYGPWLLVVVVVGLTVAIALGHRHRAAAPASDRARRADRPGQPDGRGDRPTGGPRWSGVRPLAVLVGAVVLSYPLVFREASAVHDYWTFWGVALVAVAATTVVDGAVRLTSRLPALPARFAVGLVGVLVILLSVHGAGRRSKADGYIQEGLHAIPVLAAAPRAARPQDATLAVRDGETGTPWANYLTHGTADAPSAAELLRLPPETLVFIVTSRVPSAAVRSAAVAIDGRYVLLHARDYQRIVSR